MSSHQRITRRRGSWADYESAKREWDAMHPRATYEQRDRAMRAIARRLGL